MLTVLRQRNFALLWFGGLISIMGDWVLRAALPFYVYELSGSTMATALMFAARLVPNFLLGSAAGVFADRWDRRKLMAVTSLGQAVIILPLQWVTSTDTLWIVYAVALFQTVLAVFFAPAENALLPQLVAKEQLMHANALNLLNNNLGRLIGPLVGGVLLAAAGLSSVVVFDSLTFLAAGLLIFLVRTPARAVSPISLQGHNTPGVFRRFLHDWREGIDVIRKDQVISILFVAFVLLNLGGIMLDPLGTPFLMEVVGVDSKMYGYILTIQAVGGITGALTAGKIGERLAPARVFGWGTVLVGLLQLIRYNLPTLPVVLAMTVLIGLPAAVVAIAMDTLFQQFVPNSHLGRVSGTLSTTIAVVSLVGVLGIAGPMGNIWGIVPILNFAACVTIASGLTGILFLPARQAAAVPVGDEKMPG